jgi:hypothetical protein
VSRTFFLPEQVAAGNGLARQLWGMGQNGGEWGGMGENGVKKMWGRPLFDVVGKLPLPEKKRKKERENLVEVVGELLLPGQVAAGNPVAVRLGCKLGAQLLPALM